MDKYKESVYGLAYSRLRNFHDAEDITQEVFIKAYQKLKTLKRLDSFIAWLHSITINLCKMEMRSRSRRLNREFKNEEGIIQEFHNETPLHESLNEALELLPDIYRQVLVLHYLGDMNSSEIGKFLGMSPGSVRERLSRARALLKEEMLEMMNRTFEQQKLKAGFTFNIMEIVRNIRINTIPTAKNLPWGLSLATGLIIAFLGIGQYINITEPTEIFSASQLSGEAKVSEIGEFPVDITDIAEIPSLSSLSGNGVGSSVPSLQNALFMAPQAGDTWVQKSSISEARYDLASNALNGKIYVIGGWSEKGGYIKQVEEYDPTIDKWSNKTIMLTPRSGLSSCIYNGKIYAVGGWSDGAAIELPTVEEYDFSTNQWNRKANMLIGRQFFSVNEVGGKIYAIGGWRNSTALSAVEEYDLAKDEWIKKADMPTARYGFSASVANGKIYVIGGCSLGGFPMGRDGVIPIVEEYDPILNKWTKKADAPTARMFFTTSTVNGKIYAIGGNTNKSWVLATEEYDPSIDKWTRKADIPSERQRLSSSATNGKIYVIGGTNALTI